MVLVCAKLQQSEIAFSFSEWIVFLLDIIVYQWIPVASCTEVCPGYQPLNHQSTSYQGQGQGFYLYVCVCVYVCVCACVYLLRALLRSVRAISLSMTGEYFRSSSQYSSTRVGSRHSGQLEGLFSSVTNLTSALQQNLKHVPSVQFHFMKL